VILEVNRFALERMGATEAQLRGYMTALGYETFAFMPGTTTLVRIEADQTVAGDAVFNLLFRKTAA
jgi:hypothetical protein